MTLLKPLLLLFVAAFACAKEYTIDVLVDEKAAGLVQEIKQETQTVFFQNDTVVFHSTVCQSNCGQKLKQGFDIAVFQTLKKQKNSRTYLINYDEINTAYDKARVVKATALAVYEYLRESKTDAVFLPSVQPFVAETKPQKDEKEVLRLEDLAALIAANNYGYKRNQNSLQRNRLGIEEAKSRFKPQVSVFSTYAQIDQDRARYSQGRYAQKQTTAGMKLRQLLYSNSALADIKIKKLLHNAAKESVAAANDELLYEAMLLYLDINNAKKQKQIIQTRKDFIRKNLVFAKQQTRIGTANRSDIYRWESELARANTQLANAKQQLQKQQYELFNMLGVEHRYGFADYGMNDSAFQLLSEDAVSYLQKKEVQELFFDLVARQHPLLQELEKSLLAQKEQIGMNKKAFYQPTLAVEGRYSKQLNKNGAGADFPVQTDDEEFEAMITLRFDLFDSSLKSINLQKSRLQRRDLQLSYQQAKDEIMKNIKTNYYFLQRAYDNIAYAKAALSSSKKNLTLMQDKYDRQKANIIELLDAQNSYTIAKTDHSIAVTNYLQNLVSIYFFSGKIDIIIDEDTKSGLENKIQSIVNKG